MNDNEWDGMQHTCARWWCVRRKRKASHTTKTTQSLVWDYFGMYSCGPEYAEHATVKLMWKCGLHHLLLGEECWVQNVSIGHCPGVAWGAWKHAPIIPLLRHNASIQHVHPIFLTNQNTQAVSTERHLLQLWLVTWQPARHFLASPIAIRNIKMPQHTKHNIITQSLMIIITKKEKERYLL